MRNNRLFILTEAAAMAPLLRKILVDLREARCRLSNLRRKLMRADLSKQGRIQAGRDEEAWRGKLLDCLAEADRLGVRITAGVRCEAHFPFEHKWIGPSGDDKIRPALFVYDDTQPTISEWIFDGWPKDRRKIWPSWWHIYRPGQRRKKIEIRSP